MCWSELLANPNAETTVPVAEVRAGALREKVAPLTTLTQGVFHCRNSPHNAAEVLLAVWSVVVEVAEVDVVEDARTETAERTRM